MKNPEIVFLQPRHIYAPEEGLGHIHMSAPLITAMSKLQAGGLRDFRYVDGNFSGGDYLDADILGVNLVGSPYVPVAIDIIKSVKEGAQVVLGGQIVDSLGGDFDRLFKFRYGVDVVNGNRLEVQKRVFGVSTVLSEQNTSSIKIWEGISDSLMKQYLSHEFSFYLSQGCKYRCSFCPAVKGVDEAYRDISIATKELEWLSEKALSFDISQLSFYISNLDAFQTPEKLREFCLGLIEVKNRLGISFRIRSLATAEYSLLISDSDLALAKEAGFVSVGIGADGATAAVWSQTGKFHNLPDDEKDQAEKCIRAVERISRVEIVPEILLVFGHVLKKYNDSVEDLEASEVLAEGMMNEFGAVPRPHVVKSVIPGVAEWGKSRNRGIVDMLISDPHLFQALDFTALASEISHPSDERFRDLVNRSYLRICGLSPQSTKPVYPDTPLMREVVAEKFEGKTIRELNEGRYDR